MLRLFIVPDSHSFEADNMYCMRMRNMHSMNCSAGGGTIRQTRPVATYRAESWTFNKDITKWLATFERKVLSILCGGIKGN